METSLQILEEYLKQYGWEYQISNDRLLVTGFRGLTGTFRVFIQNSENWVIFAISPFTPQPEPNCKDILSIFLLRLNDEMNLTKVSVDTDGDTVLSVEMRAEDLRIEDLSEALDALTYYADKYFLVLTNLAKDPAYIPKVDFNWDVWRS